MRIIKIVLVMGLAACGGMEEEDAPVAPDEIQQQEQPLFSGVIDAIGRIGDAVASITRCEGDCNGDRKVTVDELTLAVKIMQGTAPLSSCLAADVNRDGKVTIDEVQTAVNRSQNGCAQLTQP